MLGQTYIHMYTRAHPNIMLHACLRAVHGIQVRVLGLETAMELLEDSEELMMAVGEY